MIHEKRSVIVVSSWEYFFVFSYQCFPFVAGLGLFVSMKFSIYLENKVWLITLFGRREEMQPPKAREQVEGKVRFQGRFLGQWELAHRSKQISVHILFASKARWWRRDLTLLRKMGDSFTPQKCFKRHNYFARTFKNITALLTVKSKMHIICLKLAIAKFTSCCAALIQLYYLV